MKLATVLIALSTLIITHAYATNKASLVTILDYQGDPSEGYTRIKTLDVECVACTFNSIQLRSIAPGRFELIYTKPEGVKFSSVMRQHRLILETKQLCGGGNSEFAIIGRNKTISDSCK